MTWKEELQPASFRGVSFFVETTDTQFGRRNQVHEYPFRDEPYAEDLGKKAREYTFNAYVLGDDYKIDRDALIKAIEDNDTPGTLIHPTLGTKKVVPRQCTVSFSNREGGIEFFTLTFAEAGEKKFPGGGFNLPGLSSVRADFLSTSVISEFTSKFRVTGFIDQVSTKAQELVNQAVTFIDQGVRIGNFANPFYSTFKNTVSKVRNAISSIISNPVTLAENIKDLFEAGAQVFTDPEDVVVFAQKVFEFGDDLEDPPENTPTQTQIKLNQDQVVDLVKALAVVEMAKAVVEIEFESKQAAIEKRDQVDEEMDALVFRAGNTENDVVFKAADELRTTVLRTINQAAITLPNVSTVRVLDSVPALVFAYDVYDDAEEDEDVINRNRIRNPLFIPPQSEMEILK